MKIALVGMGKMGLPLACQFASRGAEVIGSDVNPHAVAAINAGHCPIDEPGIEAMLSEVVQAGRLKAITDTAEAVAQSDVVVVIVPALLTPDLDFDPGILQAASEQVAKSLRPGMMVCYETTMPVGGTRRFLLPVLEKSGLKAGKDFDLVFSPERVKSQKVLQHLTENSKVVGGYSPKAAERGAAFYKQYLGAPVINVKTLEAAEMVKLAGMIYRDVNIAVANELAGYAEEVGVDLSMLIEATNSDNEAALHLPGIGVGGHCTPIYPYFLIRDAERRGIEVPLATYSRRINDGQTQHVLDRFERLAWPLKGKKVLILGLAFRPQVKEHVCSTAFLLQNDLKRREVDQVWMHDPLYSDEEIEGKGFVPRSFEDQPGPDVILLNTSHNAFHDLDFEQLASSGVKAVIDGRNLWDAERVRNAGLFYLGIGRPFPLSA